MENEAVTPVKMTDEQVIHCKNLIKFFLSKYYNKCDIVQYHYELFSNCCFKAFKSFHTYNDKYPLSHYIKYVVKSEIYTFFLKLKSDKHKLSYIDNTISLDKDLTNNNSDEDFSLLNTLQTLDDFDKNFNYNYLLSIYKEATKNIKGNPKIIMDLIIKGFTDIEIAHKLNLTRQCINQYHDKLKLLMYLELKKNNYKSKYLDNFTIDFEKLPKKFQKQLLSIEEAKEM